MMKITLILFYSIFIAKITPSTTPSTSKPINFRNLSVQLVPELQAIHNDAFNCLSQNGLNRSSFDNCVGDGYSKIKTSYLDRYFNLKRELVQLYTSKIDHACEDNNGPCNDIRNSLESSIEGNEDLFNLLLAKRQAITSKVGVNRVLLDYLIDDFRRDYGVIEENKEKITKSLMSTVNQIKDYINSTGLGFNFDYKTFDPKEVYYKTGVEGDKRSDNSFNEGLAKEAGAKKLLKYYLANGMLNANQVDLTKLPSQILDELKKERSQLNI